MSSILVLILMGLFSADVSHAGDLKSVWYGFDDLRIDAMLAVEGGGVNAHVTKSFCDKNGSLEKIRKTLTRLPELTKGLSEKNKREPLEALIAAGRGLTIELEQYCYHHISLDETLGALKELRSVAMSGMGLSEDAVFSSAPAAVSNARVDEDGDEPKYIECGVAWHDGRSDKPKKGQPDAK